jgi:5-methylcytosine-specific restriction endonuclease McrBC regulatory subunit McrC
VAGRPILSVTEWSLLELPPALNNAAVKQRLLRTGATTQGDAFRLYRGNLYARGLAGLISTPDVQVQILPKTTGPEDRERGLKLLGDMFRLELGLGSHVAVATSGEHGADLMEIVISGFASALSKELTAGLPRRYFPAVEDLQTIRGRIDLDHQARIAPGAALGVRVRHAPLQTDNELSRLLKAVAVALLERTRAVANRALLLSCLDALRAVTPRPLTQGLVDHAHTNRFEARWQWAVEFGQRLVDGENPDPVRGGPSTGLAILFPLHGLFERALRARLRRGLQGDLLLRATKTIGALLRDAGDGKTLLGLEPDILVDHKGSLAVIGDAKWKLAAEGEALRDDAYQLVTYLVRANVGRGFLAYPSAVALPSVCSIERHLVNGADFELSVVRIDAERLCSSKPADIAATCDALRDLVASMLA